MDPLFVISLLFNRGGEKEKCIFSCFFSFLFVLYSEVAFNKAAYFVDAWLLRPDSPVVRATCYTSVGNRALI